MAQNVVWWLLAAGCAVAQTGEVVDCQPCRFALRSGEEQSVRFQWEKDGATRRLAAIEAGGQKLVVREAEEIGESEKVFFDAPDIDFDGFADLQVIVERGMPNATAVYWVYRPVAKKYEEVGRYPVFTLDAKSKTLTAYVKRGPAGRNATRTVYGWRKGKLLKVGGR